MSGYVMNGMIVFITHRLLSLHTWSTWSIARLGAVIHYGAISVFMALQLFNRLEILQEAAYITTHSLDSQVKVPSRESHKMPMTVQYIDHLALVHKPELLVVLMRAYDLVLRLAWFKTRKLEINWATILVTSLGTSSGQGEARRSGMIVR